MPTEIKVRKKQFTVVFGTGEALAVPETTTPEGEIILIQSNYEEVPIVDGEIFPAKNKNSTLEALELKALLTTKVSTLGDIDFEAALKYFQAAIMKLVCEKYVFSESEKQIHDTLAQNNSEISKENIELIKQAAAIELAKIEAAKIIEEAAK